MTIATRRAGARRPSWVRCSSRIATTAVRRPRRNRRSVTTTASREKSSRRSSDAWRWAKARPVSSTTPCWTAMPSPAPRANAWNDARRTVTPAQPSWGSRSRAINPCATSRASVGRTMGNLVFDREPPATLATMVIAFGGWIDAGRAATGALRHLVRDLPAERLARMDPEEFFVFTQERPEVRLRDDGDRDVHWPKSEFFAWSPGEGRDGLLLFCGPEPHQKWRTYTKAFLDVAERCGVKRIVSLGALLAGAPHTRPVRVTARCTDPASRSRLEAWGIYRRPTYEGPTGISSVVLEAAERRGIQHVGFMGQAPHYLQDSENPAAIQSLVSYTARLLHLSPDMSHFAEAIQDFRTQCDKAVARDRATREHVRKLEQEYDAEVGEERPPLPGGELDSEKLMQELEEFLRKQREGGTEGR